MILQVVGLIRSKFSNPRGFLKGGVEGIHPGCLGGRGRGMGFVSSRFEAVTHVDTGYSLEVKPPFL